MVETDRYGAFARRVIRGFGRRVGTGEIDQLAQLVGLRQVVDEAVDAAVAGLRAEPYAYSLSQIADVLGITRQSAHKRWGHLDHARVAGGQPGHLR